MSMKTLTRVSFVSVLAISSLTAAITGDTVVGATKRGDSAKVLELIKGGADVNASEPDGTTALLWAADQENLALIDALIKAGAKVGIPNRYGVEPISVAAINANVAVMDKLLKAGANPNAVQPDGITPLMLAARAGKADAVKLLLSRDAQVNHTETRRKQTALMWAVAENHADVVKLLLKAGADTNVRTTVTGFLSDQEPGERAFTAYLFGAQMGATEAVDALLDFGVDIEETLPDGAGALHLAVANDQWDLAVHLLERGANANSDKPGFTPLHYAIFNRKVNIGSITMFPVPRGKVDSLTLIRALVKHGADVNARITREPADRWIGRGTFEKTGATPFLLAAHKFDIPLMQALLDLGADPKMKTKDGTTALMLSAGLGIFKLGENPGTWEEIRDSVAFCMKIGCGEIEAKNEKGESAMHGAAYSGSAPTIDLLASAGATLDPVDKHGWTPLRIAAGVEIDGGFSSQPEAADELRKILVAKGYKLKAEEESTFSSLTGAGATAGVKAKKAVAPKPATPETTPPAPAPKATPPKGALN
jgi:ankyrin repeat protein